MVEYASVRSSLYDIDSLVSQLNERAGDGWEVVQVLPTGGDVTAVLKRSDTAASSGPEAESTADSPGLGALATGAAAGGTVAAFEHDEVIEEAGGSDGPFAGEVTETTETVEDAAGDAAGDVSDAASDAADTAGDTIAGATDTVEATESTEPPSWASAPAAAAGAEAASEPAGWAAEPEAAASDAATTVEEAPAAAAAVSDAAPAAAAADITEAAPAVESAPPAPEVSEPAPAAPTPPPAPAPATPSIPAGWYPDPSTRYELRYWDGNAWTEHVARQGQMYTDPPVA